jgi:hypothetical protein
LENIKLVEDPDKNFLIIMKDGSHGSSPTPSREFQPATASTPTPRSPSHKAVTHALATIGTTFSAPTGAIENQRFASASVQSCL